MESANETIKEIESYGVRCLAVQGDVSIFEDCEKMTKQVIEKFERIDVLVNNAGVAYEGLITGTDEVDYDRIMDINLKGVFNCCKAVTQVMVNQQSGKIINISSMWGETGASCEVAYSASKAGVLGITKALAKELAPSGITVNAVSPGIIETAMNSNLSVEELNDFVASIPLGRMGTADEIAQAVYFLASENADYITGQVLSVNGGYVI